MGIRFARSRIKHHASRCRQLDKEGSTSTSCQRRMYALNGGERVDYVLQPHSKVEVANEYYSALKAHSSYWANPDIPAFIMHEVFRSRPSQT